jgi:hypothetical protein
MVGCLSAIVGEPLMAVTTQAVSVSVAADGPGGGATQPALIAMSPIRVSVRRFISFSVLAAVVAVSGARRNAIAPFGRPESIEAQPARSRVRTLAQCGDLR